MAMDEAHSLFFKMTLIFFSFVLSNLREFCSPSKGEGNPKRQPKAGEGRVKIDLLAASSQSEWQYAIGHLHDSVITTTRALFVFPFIFKFCNRSVV